MSLKGCLEYQELLAKRLCRVGHAAVPHLMVTYIPFSAGNVSSLVFPNICKLIPGPFKLVKSETLLPLCPAR